MRQLEASKRATSSSDSDVMCTCIAYTIHCRALLLLYSVVSFVDGGPGINGALTAAQKENDHSDTLESFTKDIIKSGGGRSTPELVDVLVQKSSEVSERVTELPMWRDSVPCFGVHTIGEQQHQTSKGA